MTSLDDRISRLQRGGIVDMHFDLPLGLLLKRPRRGVVAQDFLPQFAAGQIGLLGVAVYVDDRYVPDRSLQIALDQISLLYEEISITPQLKLCRTFAEIEETSRTGQIGLLLTLEGAEPFGHDLELVRVFYELGLRALILTHARENAAGAGGIFAPSGSPSYGLTGFGRELVGECQRLGIILDLAHINAAGFGDVCALTKGPLIVSHTNARHFYDMERNISDEQIKVIGERGGVIGMNAILVSGQKQDSTLDRYVDHIEHVAGLIGIDGVGLGFDFCEFLWRLTPPAERAELDQKFAPVHFLPDLTDHSQASNLTRKLLERGFEDEDVEKILRGNWLRVLRQIL